MRYLSLGTSILFGSLALSAAASPRASATPQKRPAPDLEEADRRYEIGVGHYAVGKPAAALAEFKASLSLHPDHAASRAAVLRLESEAISIPVPPAPSPPPLGEQNHHDGAFDRLLLVTIPRWINFNNSVGDAISRAGTVDALNGRVAQLLAERRVAQARRRPFSKDKMLRALLRRVPAISADKTLAT